ncbi:unnamed protein product [Polarella glacialis]|uniref:Uncharacterized protein n=1 Tax=Polarella glacialis TaxID=89957 RepID=A0A813FEN0_POLGL|nr:unnamed protein product [Polarella glacialis]
MEDDQENDHPVRNLVLSVCDLKQHGDIPSSRCGSQTVTMATRMYLHGGCDEKQAYGDLHLLEIEQMKWTELHTEGPAPGPRWAHTVEGYETELIVFGGIASEEAALLSDNPSRGPVAPPFMPGVAWGHGAGTTNSLHKLQTTSLKWEATNCVGSPPSPRCFHSACVADDKYVVFGGQGSIDYSQPLDDIHWLDLRNNQWTSPSVSGTLPSARFGHKMLLGPDDQLLVFGGSTSAAGPAWSSPLFQALNCYVDYDSVSIACDPPVADDENPREVAVKPVLHLGPSPGPAPGPTAGDVVMAPAKPQSEVQPRPVPAAPSAGNSAGLDLDERRAREQEMAAKRQKKEEEKQRILAQSEEDRKERFSERAVGSAAPSALPLLPQPVQAPVAQSVKLLGQTAAALSAVESDDRLHLL